MCIHSIVERIKTDLLLISTGSNVNTVQPGETVPYVISRRQKRATARPRLPRAFDAKTFDARACSALC